MRRAGLGTEAVSNSAHKASTTRNGGVREFRRWRFRSAALKAMPRKPTLSSSSTESLSFADNQRLILHLIPTTPCRVVDIGAGTGRDAAGFAALGHHVVAVEPTAELRTRAMALHPSPRIEWLDDSLPDLALLMSRGDRFDVVMLTAVWMHLDAAQRQHAMPKVASLLKPGGVMSITLRYGAVPKGRRMFAVAADETVGLAAAEGLRLVLRRDGLPASLGQPGVTWTRLAFSLSRDGLPQSTL